MHLKDSWCRKSLCLFHQCLLYYLLGHLTGQFPICFSKVTNWIKDPCQQHTAWSDTHSVFFSVIAGGLRGNWKWLVLWNQSFAWGKKADDKEGGLCFLAFIWRATLILNSCWEQGLRMWWKKLISQAKNHGCFSRSSFIAFKWWQIVCIAVGCCLCDLGGMILSVHVHMCVSVCVFP